MSHQIGTNQKRHCGPFRFLTLLTDMISLFLVSFSLLLPTLRGEGNVKKRKSHIESWIHLSPSLTRLPHALWFTFSPCLSFYSLIFSGCKCALPTCPHCPRALCPIYLVTMASSLSLCWQALLCSHKAISCLEAYSYFTFAFSMAL